MGSFSNKSNKDMTETEKSMTAIKELEEFAKGEDNEDPEVDEAEQEAIDEEKKEAQKSMTSIDELEQFAKSQSMPSGTATIGQGEEQGGKLDGVGKTSGTNDAGGGEAINAPKCKEEKLSEDDKDVDEQVKPVKKSEIDELIDFTKSERNTFDTSPNGQRQSVAHEHAAKVAQLRKGEEDVTVGLGVAPPSPEPEQLEKGIQWNQGEDSLVQYSNQSDLDATRLLKSDRFYSNGSPILGRNPVLAATVQCPSCKNEMNKSLTACPTCNHGAVTHQVIPSVERATQLSKSEGRGPLRPKIQRDVYCPNGISLKEDDE